MARRAIEALPAHAAEFEAMVAERAYFKAAERGFAPGHELEDWLAAEQELSRPAPVLGEAAAAKTKKKTSARRKASTATVKKLK